RGRPRGCGRWGGAGGGGGGTLRGMGAVGPGGGAASGGEARAGFRSAGSEADAVVDSARTQGGNFMRPRADALNALDDEVRQRLRARAMALHSRLAARGGLNKHEIEEFFQRLDADFPPLQPRPKGWK